MAKWAEGFKIEPKRARGAMTAYSAETEEYITVEWDYDVSRGYPGSRTEPGYGPSVENLSAFLIGPHGERHALPDWWAERYMDEKLLIIEADEQQQASAEDAADHQRDINF